MERDKALVLICMFILLSISCLRADSSITGVLGAMDEELRLLKEEIVDGEEKKIEGIGFVTGKIRGRQVVLARSGIGKVNAAMVATLLVEHFKPDEVIFTGIAGGINPDLLPGDIVIAEKTAQHDLGILTSNGLQNFAVWNSVGGRRNPLFFPADKRLLALAEESGKRIKFGKIGKTGRTPRIIKGIVVTGDVFIFSSAKKAELHKRLKADAVEMEGAAVAQICWQQDVACLVIRCISDTTAENVEQELKEYFDIAARNSAMLVVDLIEQLASE